MSTNDKALLISTIEETIVKAYYSYTSEIHYKHGRPQMSCTGCTASVNWYSGEYKLVEDIVHKDDCYNEEAIARLQRVKQFIQDTYSEE